MPLKKITLTYLASYLLGGGLGFLIAPDFVFEVFQSNQEYGDVMPRVVGIFMTATGGLVALITYWEDYKYYPYSIAIRTVIVVVLFLLYAVDQDPLFLVFNVIVLIGLVPSYYVIAKERTAG